MMIQGKSTTAVAQPA